MEMTAVAIAGVTLLVVGAVPWSAHAVLTSTQQEVVRKTMVCLEERQHAALVREVRPGRPRRWLPPA